MLQIKVLGPGCQNCEKLEALVHKVVATLGVSATVEKVTDYGEIMQYNVLATPGLVVNGAVVASGRIPHEREVTTWLANGLTKG